jgi:hypothetical protein
MQSAWWLKILLQSFLSEATVQEKYSQIIK